MQEERPRFIITDRCGHLIRLAPQGVCMPVAPRAHVVVVAFVVAAAAFSGWTMRAQSAATPMNDLPNPYRTVENFFALPEGRAWGSTSTVDIDRDGTSIWVAERRGADAGARAAASAAKADGPSGVQIQS